jgi:hypothetical protein
MNEAITLTRALSSVQVELHIDKTGLEAFRWQEFESRQFLGDDWGNYRLGSRSLSFDVIAR